MPTYKFEALDTAGAEVKDEIDALNEEEAQQKIKQMGYFVTKLTQMTGTGGKSKKATCPTTSPASRSGTKSSECMPRSPSLRTHSGERSRAAASGSSSSAGSSAGGGEFGGPAGGGGGSGGGGSSGGGFGFERG